MHIQSILRTHLNVSAALSGVKAFFLLDILFLLALRISHFPGFLPMPLAVASSFPLIEFFFPPQTLNAEVPQGLVGFFCFVLFSSPCTFFPLNLVDSNTMHMP